MRPNQLILLACLLLLPVLVRAELVVVANPDSGIEKLTRDELVNIYLGRFRQLASGQVAEPIDAANDSPLRAEFYQQLVDRSLAEINAYWARLVFSGKTRPPQSSADVEASLRRVSMRPTALAYVPRETADKRVRIVFSFGK